MSDTEQPQAQFMTVEASEEMRAVRTSCLACARCYGSCPVHRVEEQGVPEAGLPEGPEGPAGPAGELAA